MLGHFQASTKAAHRQRTNFRDNRDNQYSSDFRTSIATRSGCGYLGLNSSQDFRVSGWTGCRGGGKAAPLPASCCLPAARLAQNLYACVQREPELIQAMTPLLSSQEQEAMTRRQLDPNMIIVEVLWDPAHQERKLSVKKITEYLNVRLRIRGEKYEYNEEEIGWKLG